MSELVAWNQMEEIVEKAANPKHGVKTEGIKQVSTKNQ